MSTDPVTGSPLDTAETSFRLLTTGPGALSLDCTAFAPALPRGEVNLAELRMLLTSRHVSDETRDAVWRELVTRARVGKGAWTVAAVGMAMPALRVIAAALTRDLPYGDPTDVDSEVLSGYLRALRRLDLDTTDVRARLCQAARCAGERAVRHIVSNAKRRQPPEESPPRQRPQPCPELVLADSVALGVLSEQDAELILLTRLGGMPLRQPPGATPPPPASSADEEAPKASARSQGTPDAATATDPKGGRDTTPGSARISSCPQPSATRGTAPATRRWNVLPYGRLRQRAARIGFRVLPMLAGAVPFVAAAATSALASSVIAAPSDLNTVFTNLRNWLIGLLATLATLMLTLGGLRYLVAGGDPGEVQKAKAALKAAAFGYALAVLAPLFVSILKRIVG
ncbi:hypothetical protein [Microbispora hainanensis]|uniref:Uncharacterized protein n=1 Tax=Microbispora hainanensis TaxID=568844 RepID=A0ABZ1SPR2_9ACTN|nr:hypothetical protein [Microbispora hainanensis]